MIFKRIFRFSSKNAVEVVDLGKFMNGSAKEKQKVADQMAEVCKNLGFMYIKNHGIPQEVIDNTLQASKTFFAQSFEEKMKCGFDAQIVDPPQSRGYIPLLGESLGQDKPDKKELMDLGRDRPQDMGTPFLGPNVWPPALTPKQFKIPFEIYQTHVHNVAIQMQRCMALSLGLDEYYFDQFFTNPNILYRILRYGKNENLKNPDDAAGCGAHSDMGFCTVLYQQPGITALQALRADNVWIDIPPIEGTFCINIGDSLERWTNGIYKSTLHRVSNYTPKERYSIATFYDPNHWTVIEPLKSCVTEEHPQRFEPLCIGELKTFKLNQFTGVPNPPELVEKFKKYVKIERIEESIDSSPKVQAQAEQ